MYVKLKYINITANTFIKLNELNSTLFNSTQLKFMFFIMYMCNRNGCVIKNFICVLLNQIFLNKKIKSHSHN